MQPPGQPDRSFQPHSGFPACQNEKQVVLVGASVRSAAESAARAGFSAIGVDLFGDTDTLAACARYCAVKTERDLDVIASICSRLSVVQVGGISRSQRLLHQLAGNLGISVIENRLDNVGSLGQLAAASSMRFPPTLELPAKPAAIHHERWLKKRLGSCGGLGVQWQGVKPQQHDRAAVLQKWIPGRTYGATLISDGATVALLGVCRSLFTRKANRPFVYAGSVGPVTVGRDVRSKLLELGRVFVATLEFRGLFNVDFVVDQSGDAWLLEINPHWSGSSELIERGLIDCGQIASHGGDTLFRRWMDVMQGESVGDGLAGTEETDASRPCYLKRIVYAHQALRFDRTSALGLLRLDESLHDIPADGTRIACGEAVCTVITRIDADAKEQDPALRHRVLIRQLRSADSYSSPRSSAYE